MAMMGPAVGRQDRLFYEFDLEERIPDDDDLLRRIDAVLDLSWLREIELNLAHQWFCRLRLEDKVPHHSTFSVNRHGRFRDSDVLRKVFESIVGNGVGRGRGLCGGRQRDRGQCQPLPADRG
jgi:Transposase domain (DUF772)